MKLEERRVPVDFTPEDVSFLIVENWGRELFPLEVNAKLAEVMSKLQIPLHHEEWEFEFSDYDLLRISMSLLSHPEEAQDFIASVYKLIKAKK